VFCRVPIDDGDIVHMDEVAQFVQTDYHKLELEMSEQHAKVCHVIVMILD